MNPTFSCSRYGMAHPGAVCYRRRPLLCNTRPDFLILAAFIGYHVAALPGAVAATAAVFTIPLVLAGFTAQLVAKLKDARWFQAFGQFAAAAAVGLLGVTLLALARPVVDIHWALLLGSAIVFAAELRGVHPIILIAVVVLLGASLPLINDALARFISCR